MDMPKRKKPKALPASEAKEFVVTPEYRTLTKNRRIVELLFPEDPVLNPFGFPDGLWAMAGGVHWPTFVEDEGLVGISHVAGFHLETRSIWFFTERKFIVLAANEGYPADAPRPLKPWLEANYEQFLMTTYYYQEHQAIASKFVLANTRSFKTRPRPHFAPFPWVESRTAMQTMHEYAALGRLKIPESRLDRELLSYDAKPEDDYPALISATVLVNGLDRYINNDYLIEKATKELRSF